MDFARKQLEKYGWSDGKGLGKHENGISEALKPKLKRSVTGVGHDPAAEFNEHWWSALYDKAAKNVEVEEKNGKTKKIKTVDSDNFTITNSTWKINKKKKDTSDNEYSDYFIKKATLQNGGSREENVTESELEDEEEKKDVFKMTDEELFAACEGRTAHKGARHGLKALGKLARIAEQEEMLLTQSKYEGYSHAKRIKKQKEAIFEDISLEDNKDKCKNKKEKKKKRKRCISNEIVICDEAESESIPKPSTNQKLKSNIYLDNDTSEINNENCGTKTKTEDLNDTANPETDCNKIFKKSKKSNKRKSIDEDMNYIENGKNTTDFSVPKKKKKKKHKTEV